MKRSKTLRKIILVLMMVFLVMNLHEPASVQASSKMPKKLYKLVKGKWYTEACGGYYVRFTKTRVKFYSRKTNKLTYNYKIKKVRKLTNKQYNGMYKGRYQIIYKTKYGNHCFITTDKKAKGFDYNADTSKLSFDLESSLIQGKIKSKTKFNEILGYNGPSWANP